MRHGRYTTERWYTVSKITAYRLKQWGKDAEVRQFYYDNIPIGVLEGEGLDTVLRLYEGLDDFYVPTHIFRDSLELDAQGIILWLRDRIMPYSSSWLQEAKLDLETAFNDVLVEARRHRIETMQDGFWIAFKPWDKWEDRLRYVVHPYHWVNAEGDWQVISEEKTTGGDNKNG